MLAKLTIVVVAALIGAPASADSAAWTCDRSPLVITNASMWTDGRQFRGREIVIVDGFIAAVGLAGHLRRPATSRLINARGAWVLPGLIDSHVHYGRAAQVSPNLLPKPYPGAWGTTGRQTLASGVTTVRSHLSDFERAPAWTKAARDDCYPSPRIEMGGGGLMGGRATLATGIPQVSGADDAREKVQANVRAGAKWLALHDTQQFAPAEISAITDEARQSGLLLMGGGSSFEETLAGLRAGVRSIEHFDESPADRYPDALIEQFRHNGTYVIAPIGFLSRYNAYHQKPALIDTPLVVRMENPTVGSALIAAARRSFEKPSAVEQGWVDNFPVLRAKFRQLLKAGVKLVVGSDSGSQGQFQSDAIWWELRAWRDNGASIQQILTAATSRPAKMLGLPDRGSIRPGARGDLVLYEGNLPRGQLDLKAVRIVAKGGVVFVRDGRWVGPSSPDETS